VTLELLIAVDMHGHIEYITLGVHYNDMGILCIGFWMDIVMIYITGQYVILE
jgi:hypothetical protein